MKCDGQRPVCSTCAKSVREYECKYEEKSPYSRRQLLEIKVNRLETRLRELLSNRSKQAIISPISSSSSTPSLSARSLSPRTNPDASQVPRDIEMQDYGQMLEDSSKISTDFAWLDMMSSSPSFLQDIALSPPMYLNQDVSFNLVEQSDITLQERDML